MGPLFFFFSYLFFLPFFLSFLLLLIFSFFHFFCSFLHFLIFSCFSFSFFIFSEEKVSSFLFSCISFKYVSLLATASAFNHICFLRSRCSREMWCPDDKGRDSWGWVGPPAWERACFNSPEWGGGSSPAKTETLQIVLLLLLFCCVLLCCCGLFTQFALDLHSLAPTTDTRHLMLPNRFARRLLADHSTQPSCHRE